MRQRDKWYQIKEGLSNLHPGLTTHRGQTPGEISHTENSSDVSKWANIPRKTPSIIVTRHILTLREEGY